MRHHDRAAVAVIDALLLALALTTVGLALSLGYVPAPLLPLSDG